MSELVNEFFAEVKATQMIWALQDKSSEGWVIVDSANFEETETMLLWSTESAAKANCTNEWADYTPTQISVSDWLEFWFEDLKEDNITIGLEWNEENDCEEMDLAEFTQNIADIEKL